jgi:hypothetical protein
VEGFGLASPVPLPGHGAGHGVGLPIHNISFQSCAGSRGWIVRSETRIACISGIRVPPL